MVTAIMRHLGRRLGRVDGGRPVFLHLLSPDRKFFDPIRRVFEAAVPGRHRWVVVGPIADGFVLPTGVNHVMGPTDLRNVLRSSVDWEGVVLNGLSFPVAGSMMRGVPAMLSVAWYVWGFEAYGYWRKLRARLLLPQTARLFDREQDPGLSRNLVIGPALRRIRRTDRDARSLVSRLDYCVTPLREEHELFVSAGLPAKTQYHWGLVGCLDDYVGVDGATDCGDDVQLGNSASVWNNHLDALALLSRPGLGSRRVVVPLGYGEPWCGDAVAAYGREVLGENFYPLMGFLPPDEYLTVVGSCGHVVMNHLRQQALGNIFASLWRGARVYMNDTSAYRGLRRMGFDVRLISEQLAGPEGLRFDSPPPEEAARHRDLLREQYAPPIVIEQTRDLLERLSALSAKRRRKRRKVE